jgi:WD40 repeat protein
MKFSPLLWVSALGAVTLAAQAQKVTYDDQVLPILRNSCLKCHNPDKAKGDLDLSTHAALLKGGSSGPVVVGGNPDSSKLFKVITHAEEPTMPPNAGKIALSDIDMIRKWIAGGLLENSGSKAVLSNRPKVDLSIASTSIGRPAGPPPMPGDLLLEPLLRTERTSASTALASSPWAPVAALGGQRQVLLYNTDTLELAGVLPFPEGYPSDLKFSRNGKLLLCGGGRGSKTGLVAVWDIATGERVITVGDEPDAVLAADISGDQKWIALGGPGRLVKIYSTKTGDLIHKIKKHTEWVTAMEFSPDSRLLATGDRNGGLHVWESDSGEEAQTLAGHRGAVTGIAWCGTNLVSSAGEDGAVKLWNTEDGAVVRNLTAHSGGAVALCAAQDGRFVTAGRDRRAVVWGANGSSLRTFAFTNDIPIRAAFTHDAARVIGSDWNGNVSVWNATNGVLVGEISLNPLTLADRLAAAQKRLPELEVAVGKAEAGFAAAISEADKLKADLAAAPANSPAAKDLAKKSEAAAAALAAAKAATDLAPKTLAAAKAAIEQLKLAQFYTGLYHARAGLASKKRDQEQLLATAAAALAAAKGATADLAAAKKLETKTKAEKESLAARVKQLTSQIKDEEAKAKTAKNDAEKLAKPIAADQTKVDKLNADYQKLKQAASAVLKTAQR